MILNNYWLYKSQFTGFNPWGNVEQKVTSLFKDLNGNYISELVRIWANTGVLMPAIQNHDERLFTELIVGSGDTKEEMDDYNLENNITTSFSSVNKTFSVVASGDTFKTIYSITGNNATNSPLIIREVGIIKRFLNDNDSFAGYSLLARKVLDNPITVNSNEGFYLNFEWSEQ